MTQPLRRRIAVAGGRRVYLWTGGEGPAVVLIHGSPGNAWLVKPIAEKLAQRFCVYAVDSPGFGGSDAIAGPIDHVAQLAEGYLELLDALGLANVLVYGTHSGAAIGLALAHRYPARVTGFVLEGVPAFTLEEQRPLLDPHYLMAFDPDVLGGHFARAWTRFHDQFVWFPWYERCTANLNEATAGSAADIHLWVEMYFQALRHEYRPAYRAVIAFGAAALSAARQTHVPGVYIAERSDMLFSHLDRLPPLHAGQHIERIMRPVDVLERIDVAMRSLPPSATGRVSPDVFERHEDRFYDLPQGQVLLRSRISVAGTPLLLLHDAPGAGRQLLALYDASSAYAPVLLPDLPGCGDSDPLEGVSPDRPIAALAEHADALASLLSAYLSEPAHVYAVGIGAALALELNARRPDLVAGLTLTGLLRTVGTERREMLGRLAPPIALAEDGSHWYRTWLMLRNSLVRWPWYDKQPASLRRQPVVFDADQLHAWTCDVMRQWQSYHRLIDAVLGWIPQHAIELAMPKLRIGLDAHHALYVADLEWAASGIKSISLPQVPADRARVLAGRCD